MFKALTRNLESSVPKEILTGDSILDDYLKSLDVRLAGGKKVRKAFLLEIQDHLLEKKKNLLETLPTEENASKAAVEEMGPPEELARSQSSATWRTFWRHFLSSSSIYFFAMLFFSFIDEKSGTSALNCFFQSLWFGICMAWLFAFVFPPHQIDVSNIQKDTYTVEYSKGLRFLSISLSLFSLFIVLNSLTNIFGNAAYVGIFKTKAEYIFFGTIYFLLIPVFFANSLRIYVSPDGLAYQRLLWKKHIPWKHIVQITPAFGSSSWIPHYWKNVLHIRFQINEKKHGTIPIYPDMHGRTNLLLEIEKRIDQKPQLESAK